MKRLCLAVLLGLGVAAHAAEPADADTEHEVYRLGYEVYLQRGNLAGAFLMASKALELAPDDAGWLLRYARVAEWVGQPGDALQAWLKLAQHTGGEEAWTAVGRLAPSLLDDEALLAYQRHEVASKPWDPQLIARLVQTCERLGRGDDALHFLLGLDQRQPHRELLEVAATLAERSGADQQALQLLDALIQRYGPQQDWVMQRSLLHYNRGELDQSWEEMHALERVMPAQATEFWRTYAGLSTMLSHRNEAIRAYQTLLDGGQAQPADEANYVETLQLSDGLAAARLSEALYRRHGRAHDLVTAIYLFLREKHEDAAEKLLASLKPAQLAAVQGDGDFLQERGELRWREMHLARARQDFERAWRLQPYSVRNLQALTGVLEDQGDTVALQPLLSRFESFAEGQPSLWLQWASGWNLLQQPQRALPFLRSYCQANPDHTGAWLELAQTYADLGDAGSAGGIRRWLWQRAVASGGKQDPALANATFDLALDQAAPEQGRRLLQARLADTGGRDLALGWLLRQGSDDAAQAWMNHAYRGDAPAWARLGLALREQDQATLTQLLDTVPEQLPQSDLVTASATLGRSDAATSLAFAGVELHPDSDEQQEQLQQLLAGRGDWVGLEAGGERLGVLQRRQAGLSWSGEFDPVWRWQLQLNRADLRSSDPTQMLSPPMVAERVSGQLSRRQGDSETSLLLARSDALAAYSGTSLTQLWHLDAATSLRWSADYNAPADESAALLAGGSEDQFTLNYGHDSGSLHGGLTLSDASYFSQDRHRLGQGQVLTVEGGLALTGGSEPQALRLLAGDTSLHANERPLSARAASLVPNDTARDSAFFVPGGYEQVGLYWVVGDQSAQSASHEWRYFAELGPSYASSVGAGHELLLGVAGPVLGGDRLAFSVEHARSGQQNGSLVERVGLDYRFFY